MTVEESAIKAGAVAACHHFREGDAMRFDAEGITACSRWLREARARPTGPAGVRLLPGGETSGVFPVTVPRLDPGKTLQIATL